MKVLITGASSGIGLSFAKYCNVLGYDLVLITRNKDKLNNLFVKVRNKAKAQ